MPHSRLLQPVTADLESDGAVSFFEPVRDEHSMQPLRAASFSDGTWHHADVKGLAVDEYQRLVQLTEVFGDDTQIVRTPKKLGPDETWAIAYKNHTVDPFEAEERGVKIVHLRPAGKKKADKAEHKNLYLSASKFLQKSGFIQQSSSIAPTPNPHNIASYGGYLSPIDKKLQIHLQFNAGSGKLYWHVSVRNTRERTWEVKKIGEGYGYLVLWVQDYLENKEPNLGRDIVANRRFSPAAKKIITYLKNRGWKQESNMGTRMNWYVHRGYPKETFFVDPDKDVTEDEGVWLHGYDSEGPSGFTYAGFVAHYNELEEQGKLPGKPGNKQANVDNVEKIRAYLKKQGFNEELIEDQAQFRYSSLVPIKLKSGKFRYVWPLIFLSLQAGLWTYTNWPKKAQAKNNPPDANTMKYSSYAELVVIVNHLKDYIRAQNSKTSAERTTFDSAMNLLRKNKFVEAHWDEGGEYEWATWTNGEFEIDINYNRTSKVFDWRVEGSPRTWGDTFSTLAVWITENVDTASGKTSAFEPNPTYFKLLDEHGFKQQFIPQELYFYTKGPWCIMLSSHMEGADSDGAFWHEEAKEVGFHSPAELLKLLEEHAI
jgi:hypothetical protein